MMLLALMASPLEHVVQHPIVERDLDLGGWPLTPEGKITLLSDQIVMMILAGLLLILLVPALVRRRRSREGIGSMVPAGPANAAATTSAPQAEPTMRSVMSSHVTSLPTVAIAGSVSQMDRV